MFMSEFTRVTKSSFGSSSDYYAKDLREFTADNRAGIISQWYTSLLLHVTLLPFIPQDFLHLLINMKCPDKMPTYIAITLLLTQFVAFASATPSVTVTIARVGRGAAVTSVSSTSSMTASSVTSSSTCKSVLKTTLKVTT